MIENSPPSPLLATPQAELEGDQIDDDWSGSETGRGDGDNDADSSVLSSHQGVHSQGSACSHMEWSSPAVTASSMCSVPMPEPSAPGAWALQHVPAATAHHASIPPQRPCSAASCCRAPHQAGAAAGQLALRVDKGTLGDGFGPESYGDADMADHPSAVRSILTRSSAEMVVCSHSAAQGCSAVILQASIECTHNRPGIAGVLIALP